MSYRRPGSTDIDTGSGRSTRRRNTFIDPAMATLEATRGFTKRLDKRVQDVRDYENEVAQRNINLQDKVEGLKGLEDLNPFSYLQNDLMDMVSNINKLDIESFEGDRSAYNKELSKINRILDNYQSFVGGLDATIDEYQAKSATELHRDISRTALQNDPRVSKYRKFLDNPSKAKFKIEDGEMVVYNGDERLFNAVEFVNSTKKGFQMVPYTPDMSDKITEVQIENYKGLDNLTKKIIEVEVKGKNRDYNSLTSTEKINYEKAIDAYVDRLKNDPAVDALVNESTFQRFITGNDVYDKTKDESRTKDELIKFMVKEQFAGGKEVETLMQEKLAAKPKPSEKNEALQSALKYKGLFTKEVNSVQGILDAKEPVDKVKKYIQVMNTSRKLSGKDLLKYDEDAGMVFIEIPGKGVDSPSTTEEWASFDQIADKSFYQLLDEANINRGDKAIPTADFSILLGNVKQLPPSVQKIIVSNQSFVTDPTSSATTEAARNLGLNLDIKPEMTDEEKMNNAEPGDEIILSDGRKIRKKLN
jgi:hypothetical protein